MATAVKLGSSFGQAVCKHFGLDPSNVSSDIKLNTRPDEVFGVTLTITLEPKDIQAIGKIMEDSAQGAK